MSEPTAADRRAAYPYFTRVTTRWMDNDPYAHGLDLGDHPFDDGMAFRGGVAPRA